MNFILDVALAAIIVFFTVRAYSRGLVRTLFGLVSLVLAYLLAMTFSPVLSDYLNQHGFLDEAVNATAHAFVNEQSVLPGMAKAGIDINGPVTHGVELLIEAASERILSLISFSMIFVGVSILLQPVRIILYSIVKLPVISTVNRILGLLFGVLQGFVAVVFVCAAITLVCALFHNENFAAQLSLAVEYSYFCQKIYQFTLSYML